MGKIKQQMEKAGDWVVRNQDEIEFVCDTAILAASACIVGYILGHSRGLQNGYSIGVIAGQNSILSKMEMVVKKGA